MTTGYAMFSLLAFFLTPTSHTVRRERTSVTIFSQEVIHPCGMENSDGTGFSKNDKGKGKSDKGKGKSSSTSRKRIALAPADLSVQENMICSTAEAATLALSGGDAQALAQFFRNIVPANAKRGGPEHTCLKRAFNLMDGRWRLDAQNSSTLAAGFASFESRDPVGFGGSRFLPADSFAIVVEFLPRFNALRTTSTSKAWWRTMSVLPVAMHMDLSLGKAFHSSYDKSTRAIGWQDLLAQLKFIRNANPHRAVRRLTFSSGVKLGSMTNLSSATAGLLSHVDFTRAKGVNKLKFDDLAVNLPGLRGLAVRETFYNAHQGQVWLKSLGKFMGDVSLQSLRLRATQYSHGRSWADRYSCIIDNSTLTTFAEMGASLEHLWMIAGSQEGEDIEEGMAALGAGVPKLQRLVVDELRVTDQGWRAFADARRSAARPLLSICIKTPGPLFVPSEETRASLVGGAVTESLTLYSARQEVVGKISNRTLKDCNGRDVVESDAGGGEGKGRLRVTHDGPWNMHWDLNAGHL